MSGGVDSSVAAALLQEQGYEVSGVFMKNWSPESVQSLTDCPWEQDQADAEAVCAKLGIPFRSINFEREYKERVVDYFLAEYAAGRTPNPDVMCNKEIKFKAFLKAAEDMGADFIATGHYARTDAQHRLLRGYDRSKDQSYFLYTLGEAQLARTLFPLGELTKPEVRLLAERFELPTAKKKDSQGICFIGHIDLKKFLMEHITSQPGEVRLLPVFSRGLTFAERCAAAAVVGRHEGVAFYTVGERAGQTIDNGLYKKATGLDVAPLYILDKNVVENTLYVTADSNDEHFEVSRLWLTEWHTTGGAEVKEWDPNLVCQVRYQQSEAVGVSEVRREGTGAVVTVSSFPESLRAVAPGQSLVVYRHGAGVVVGGGIVERIERVHP